MRQITQNSVTPVKFDNLLEEISPFANTTGSYIEPYHDSFRRYIISKLKSTSKIYHKRLAKYYSDLGTSSIYGTKHVIRHIEEVGHKDKDSIRLFKKLDKENFFEKVLRFKIDDPTKVEIGKSFAHHFYLTKNVPAQVKYAILSSNIYPTIHGDNTYNKVYIGTEKLLLEAEEELMSPKSGHDYDKREWVFRRLSIGNLLKERGDKISQNLSRRFLDDGLFRLSLDNNLLWDEDAKREFWQHTSIIMEAFVNTGQYTRAIRFLKKGIRFNKKTKHGDGLIASKIGKVHLQNFKYSESKTLEQVKKGNKIERLFFYLGLWTEGKKVSSYDDLMKIISDQNIEGYLLFDDPTKRLLDFITLQLFLGPRKYKARIKNNLNKIKLEAPYYDHGFAHWGDMGAGRQSYLSAMALMSYVDGKFDFQEYYKNSLKDRFKKRADDSSEYENKSFIDVIALETELYRMRLLHKLDRFDWKAYWKLFESTLKKYNEKVQEVRSTKDQYSRREMEKTHYPYVNDLPSLVGENLSFIVRNFPKKTESSLKKIEKVLGTDELETNMQLLDTVISSLEDTSSYVREKLDRYLGISLNLKRSEVTDSMDKSNNLEDLALLAAKKNRHVFAERVFTENLNILELMEQRRFTFL